jgi:hypothetical protein
MPSAQPVALLLLLSIPATLAAQGAAAGQAGHRTILPEAREIALARSAAPAAISATAEVWVLGETGYRLAVAGTSGAACMVSRSWIQSIEPVCYDPEGAATIMKMEIRRTELLHGGMSVADAEREVQAAIDRGEIRVPSRVAVSWMQSSAQRLISDDGRPVGAWQPHLMLYSPDFTAVDLGLASGAGAGGIMVVDPGTPKAMLLIVAGEFVDLVEIAN